ncbi:MAG: GIY-YIG nuclease family protein [Patescibacteria group bacterium]
MKKYYFYLARCSDNTLYCGYCRNLSDRENKHNNGDGAKYTKQRRPIKIVYSEQFNSISEAMKREAQVKSWKREEKEKLIKN